MNQRLRGSLNMQCMTFCGPNPFNGQDTRDMNLLGDIMHQLWHKVAAEDSTSELKLLSVSDKKTLDWSFESQFREEPGVCQMLLLRLNRPRTTPLAE